MLDSSARAQFVELARARLAAPSGPDQLLSELRQQGLTKIDCIWVLQDAAGLSLQEAKHLVHHSPAWADRRDADDHLQELLWRTMFIECLLGRGQINQPDEWAAEYRERQQQAKAQLHNLAASLPNEALNRYREFITANLLGRAFAALVEAGQHHPVPDHYWATLANVAETLCLNELLGEDEPTADTDDYLQAAHLVRRLTTRPG